MQQRPRLIIGGLLGSLALAGCGVSGHLSATPTGNGAYQVPGTAHTSDASIPASNSSRTDTVLSRFNTYRNTLYHFSLSYPKNFTPLPSPTDSDGKSFIFKTHVASYSNQGEGFIGVPKQAAVIDAVGVYNAAHMTYAKAKKRPNNPFITSYHVGKYGTGYEIQEHQRRGMELSYSIMFFNQTYVKTLKVVVPNQTQYKQIALAVVKSFNPLS